MNTRLGITGGLDTRAEAEAQTAADYAINPQIAEVTKRLADALKEQPKLKAEMEKTAATLREYEAAVARKDPSAPFAYVVSAAEKSAADAAAMFATNEGNISGDRGFATSFANRQTTLNSAAARSKGFATGNRSRMVTLSESIIEQERQRRAGISQQFDESGVGFGTFMPGAGAAAVARGSGQRASPRDAMDFNTMMNQVKSSMRESFAQALMEIFRDGVVTPEEVDKLRRDLKTWGTRP
ncbi:MAG: hypothetical protein E4H01_15585 [Lysobacterales bacterium]|nr:MAG: hypothetical protein E4H01_15585 [Xanthomonadales bacterium]